MNRVAINGRFVTQDTTGVQRYAREMVRAVDALLTRDSALGLRYQFDLLVPSAGTWELEAAHIRLRSVGHLKGQAWEQLELPRHTGQRPLLNLCNTAPLAGRGIVTIHDASVFAVPAAYSLAFRTWYRILLPYIGKRALTVITVSEFSRAELSRRAAIPVSRIQVIYPGAEHVLQVPADPGIFGRVPVQSGSYLLAVGSRSPHKNVDAVVRAMSHLGENRPPLVTAGGVNTRVFNEAGALDGRNVFSAGYVTDGELRALYENAIGLVYPSRYEGFGLPPLEAMACGCPVLVARAASLPEVCGDAALYCDPDDPADIAHHVELMLEPDGRNDLRRRGLERARCFTWERAARSLLGVLDRVGQR